MGAFLKLFEELGDNWNGKLGGKIVPVSYTHLRAHETVLDLVCRLLLEKNRDTIVMNDLR